MDLSTWQKSDWKNADKAIQVIKSLIRDVQDFPKKGILFKDIMPIFQIPDAVEALTDIMADYIKTNYTSVDVIVGLDARGFLIGPMIAVKLGKAFVPVRKAGKLPGKCISVDSVKEYGKDVLEMQVDGMKTGQNVVIIDDLLATGGTMEATCDLVSRGGGNVLGCFCVVELSELNGRSKVKKPFHALIDFN